MEELIKVADVCAIDPYYARQIIDSLRDSGFIIAYVPGYDNQDEFQIFKRPEAI